MQALLRLAFRRSLWRRRAAWIVLGILLPMFAPATFGLVMVVAVLGGGAAYMADPWDGEIPKDVSPAHGIPSMFVAYVQQASLTYRVPMQFIAGEVMVESAWDPTAYTDYGGSHAMGLMQFEPETWSGWSNPYCRIDEPDTDAQRIQQYGGYGVDADGMWAPIGTPSQAASHIATLNAQCQARGNTGCAPYASPWDPADALAAGAKYLSTLYNQFGTWASASAHYYGGAGQDQYVASVMRYTYAYVLDTPPLQLDGGGFWPFGEADLAMSSAENGWWSVKGESKNPVVSQFLPSLPIVAPASGAVTWRTSGGTTTIALPLPSGGTLTIRVPNEGIIKWALAKNEQTGTVSAGDIVGFIDAKDGFEVSGDLDRMVPGGKLTGGVLHPPGHAVAGGDNG
ncbi:transglycosylase SLT domain-containing protein [Alicyclobacillus macrosporangiidus]|uniref:transglycosylase SLT domain-containing protein n=1 Tax=Alicyclobacillus macrosporangiidus TaxID=392015 RepID=UPI0004963289|nr:transglycosylase SLT domain-containing protein [Alicyclobacillus macrosporangiidus]